MKSIFETVIRKGGFDLTAMLKRIDEYHISGALTDHEREKLIAAARGRAMPGVDAAAEIQQLWGVVHDLIRRVSALEGDAAEDGGAAAEFIQPSGVHDAYYAGDLVSWQGQVMECVAPEGVACVWSPEVMPGYWQAV